ncbi:MAG: hypothetical protein QOF84_4461 [Streptomyces sp.]|jgi:hypothetical protein|nr:hypothetical protein [Streptomyces sp.]
MSHAQIEPSLPLNHQQADGLSASNGQPGPNAPPSVSPVMGDSFSPCETHHVPSPGIRQ